MNYQKILPSMERMDRMLDISHSRFFKILARYPRLRNALVGYLGTLEPKDDDASFHRAKDQLAAGVEFRVKDGQWLDLFYHSPIGIASADIHGHLKESNPSFQKMLGYSQGELCNLYIADVTHPDHREAFEKDFEKLFEGVVPMFQTTKRCIRKDGSTVWTRDTLSIVKNARNEPEAAIAIVEDITELHLAEEARRLSEGRWKATVTYTTVGITLFALDGSIIDCNPAFASMLGYTQEECVKLSIQAVTSPEYLPEVMDKLKDLVDGRVSFFRIEAKCLRKDGTEIWVQSTASLACNRCGEMADIVAITEDISRRLEIEDNLKKSEERLKMAVTVSKIGFYDWDIASDSLTVSSRLCEDLSCDADGMSILEGLKFVVPEDLRNLDSALENAAENSSKFEAELRMMGRDGKLVWLEIRGQLTFDESNCPAKFFGTALNITKRKHIEEVRRANEEKLRLATEAAKVGIWDFDFETEKVKCSDRMKEILEIDQQQEVTIPFLMRCLHPDDRQRAQAALDATCDPKGSGAFEINLRNVLHDGSIRWTMSRGQTLFEGKGPSRHPVRFTGALLDLSEQMQLQEELQASKIAAEAANETKSAFLANMSHEVRTPLGAIMGFADLLAAHHGSSEDQDEYLRIIRRNAYALMHIVNDILDLSKVEAGLLDIEKLDVSLYQLMEEVIGIFHEKAKKKAIYLRYVIDKSVPKLISSDPTRLRQVLINLIDNAIKFTEKGGVDVLVNAAKVKDRTYRLSIIVSDTGIGLSPKQLKKLFRPFSQADSSTTRRFGGTGLGLFLSKSLAHALEGDLEVLQCKPDKGCSFEFTFLADASSVTRHPSIEKKGLEAPIDLQLPGTRILIAEDALDNQLLLSTVLTASGAQVKLASNGAEAVSMALKDPFDIILMDLQMPQMDGYEATRILRDSGYRGPIVALTAHAMKEDRQRTKGVGCNCHLTKPLNLDELLKTIRYYS